MKDSPTLVDVMATLRDLIGKRALPKAMALVAIFGDQIPELRDVFNAHVGEDHFIWKGDAFWNSDVNVGPDRICLTPRHVEHEYLVLLEDFPEFEDEMNDAGRGGFDPSEAGKYVVSMKECIDNSMAEENMYCSTEVSVELEDMEHLLSSKNVMLAKVD